MRFLFRSDLGSAIPIALRLEQEGHETLFCMMEKGKGSEGKVGEGLIDKTKDFPAAVKWAEIVVYDGNRKGMPDEAELLRRTKPVVGCSKFGDELEHNREHGIKVVEEVGLDAPEYERFKGPSAFVKAARFVQEQDEDTGWVIKPNVDSFRTCVTYSVEELLRMLTWAEKKFEKLKVPPDFILERRHDGIAVDTEAWFDGQGWSVPNCTLETNRLMDADLGEIIGCAGNVVWLCPSMNSPLPQAVIVPLTKVLEGKYRGPVDIHYIVDKQTQKLLFLEFTTRFGYSAIFSLMELVPDFGRLLGNIAQGKPYDGPLIQDRFAIGLRATIPPFPNCDDGEEMAVGLPILGYDPESPQTGVNPMEVRLDREGCPETSGPEGLVFEFTASATTIPEARRLLYEKIRKIHVPNIRYRTDIGLDSEVDFGKLVALKLADWPEKPFIFSSVLAGRKR